MGMIKKLVAAFRRDEAAIDAPQLNLQEAPGPDPLPVHAEDNKKFIPVLAPKKPVPEAGRRPKNNQETKPGSIGVKRVVLGNPRLPTS